jgi:hypothetical protein
MPKHRIISKSPIGLPAPPAGELNVKGDWLTPEDAVQARRAITGFLAHCQVTLVPGCPLSRWLDALAETEHARENWRGAFSKDSPHDHRKAHDLIEAWRLAWSLRALFAPGRPEPAFDKSFVTDQLMGEDYQEPDSGLRMPLGTGSLFLAARLQQISPGELHFLGNQSPGVDLEYVGDPVRQHGRVFIEHKERAYLKSRSRTKEDLLAAIRSRIDDGARGLAEATRGKPAGRVVLIGASPDLPNVDWVLDEIRSNLGRWCGDMMRRANGDRSVMPHAVMLLAAAHGLEPKHLRSALRGGLVLLKPIGSDPSDGEWKRVLDTFNKAGGDQPSSAAAP